jgi:hypothetical protein
LKKVPDKKRGAPVIPVIIFIVCLISLAFPAYGDSGSVAPQPALELKNAHPHVIIDGVIPSVRVKSELDTLREDVAVLRLALAKEQEARAALEKNMQNKFDLMAAFFNVVTNDVNKLKPRVETLEDKTSQGLGGNPLGYCGIQMYPAARIGIPNGSGKSGQYDLRLYMPCD